MGPRQSGLRGSRFNDAGHTAEDIYWHKTSTAGGILGRKVNIAAKEGFVNS